MSSALFKGLICLREQRSLSRDNDAESDNYLTFCMVDTPCKGRRSLKMNMTKGCNSTKQWGLFEELLF